MKKPKHLLGNPPQLKMEPECSLPAFLKLGSNSPTLGACHLEIESCLIHLDCRVSVWVSGSKYWKEFVIQVGRRPLWTDWESGIGHRKEPAIVKVWKAFKKHQKLYSGCLNLFNCKSENGWSFYISAFHSHQKWAFLEGYALKLNRQILKKLTT